jgi:hypothetical protein
MRRHTSAALTLPVALLCAAGWWGCAKGATPKSVGTGGTINVSSSASSGGAGGIGNTGGAAGAGGSGGHDAGSCTPTSTAPATHFPVDMIFVLDQSTYELGASWATITKDLPAFFKDPASAGIAAGLMLFPYAADDCDLEHYEVPTVAVGALPANAAALTSALPASAIGVGRPVYPALQGALLQATARKDANPTHTVMVVIAMIEADVCDLANADLATLAAGALSYNGVLTHVLALPNAVIALLNVVAAAGGTSAAHDLTAGLGSLSTTLAAIRASGFGCSYQAPTPPNNQPLDPNQVNLSYTPMGTGSPIVLLRASDAASCNGQPGWYWDDPTKPTKMVLCPQSCATVQADTSAVVDVQFGCASQQN